MAEMLMRISESAECLLFSPTVRVVCHHEEVVSGRVRGVDRGEGGGGEGRGRRGVGGRG